MAIINSYPLATPKVTDLVLGTSTSSTGQTSTKSFTVQSIKDTTAGVQTITTTIPATLNITGSGTANVTINAVTAAITSGGAALATSGEIYTFLTDKITGTPNTVPIWTDATTLGNSLISQANNSVIINGSGTDGRIQLNCSATTHGVGIQSPPHSVSATYDWILPQAAGTAGQVLTSGVKTGVADQLTWSDNGNVGGTGTQNKLPKWTDTTILGDSIMTEATDTISIAGNLSLQEIEVNETFKDGAGLVGGAGQLLSSTGTATSWVTPAPTGVASLSTTNTNLITITSPGSTPHTGAVVATPNISGGVSSSSQTLATGAEIQTAINTALAGAVTFKGTFNASTGAITSGGNLTSGGSRVAVAVGDMYVVNVGGNFYGNASTPLNVGDEVIAVSAAVVGASVEGDWNAVPSAGGGITGGGTTNKVPLWTGATALGDSAIAQSGTNIGIGTTSPSEKLEVIGNVRADVSNGGGFMLTGGSASGLVRNNATGVALRTNTTDRLIIDSSGNIGIGTTSPQVKLEIQQPQITTQYDTGSFFRLHPSATTNSSGFTNMFFGTSTSNNYGVAIGGLRAGTGDTSSNNNPEFTVRILNDSITGTQVLNINTQGQVKFNNYTSSGSFTGTAAANLAVDSSGNIITEAAGGSGGGNRTVTPGTGDGTTTDFTMGVAFTSVDYVDVYISGVYQQKATYSQPNGTGTTLLRFTTAPPTTSTNGIDFVINH